MIFTISVFITFAICWEGVTSLWYNKAFWEFYFKRSMLNATKNDEEILWLNAMWLTESIRCVPLNSTFPYRMASINDKWVTIHRHEYKQYVSPKWHELSPAQWETLIKYDELYAKYQLLYI